MFIIALWLFNIAMENDPFIDYVPNKSDDCPWLLNNQRVNTHKLLQTQWNLQRESSNQTIKRSNQHDIKTGKHIISQTSGI